MKSFKRVTKFLGFVSLFVILSTTCLSAGMLDKSDNWQSFLSVYSWFPAFTGDVRIKGLESGLDTTYDSLYLGGHYEGFKGNWGIMVDGMYGQQENSQSHSGNTKQFKVNQSLVELAIPYRLAWKPVVADIFVGGRYNYMDGEIGIPSVPVKRDQTLAFVDPIVGGRVFFPISKRWSIGLRGDVGGFGIGNASDLALNGNASLNWQITNLLSLHGGYRALYMKYNSGDNEWNATQHGPWCGLGLSF